MTFHEDQKFVNRLEGIAALETKYKEKKPFESKKLTQRFTLEAVLATQC